MCQPNMNTQSPRAVSSAKRSWSVVRASSARPNCEWMDLIVSSGSVFSVAFGFYSRVTSLYFASASGSENEAAYIVVNFGDSGGNNGTIRFTLRRRFQRWLIHILAKFDPLCENLGCGAEFGRVVQKVAPFLTELIGKKVV